MKLCGRWGRKIAGAGQYGKGLQIHRQCNRELSTSTEDCTGSEEWAHQPPSRDGRDTQEALSFTAEPFPADRFRGWGSHCLLLETVQIKQSHREHWSDEMGHKTKPHHVPGKGEGVGRDERKIQESEE